MRITGGRWRSRRLQGPRRSWPLRPTPDALRERAFAVLGAEVEGARVLDLFAGTGAVGFEALSRGARQAVFVEIHRGAAGVIEANREALGLGAEQVRVLVRPAMRAVAQLARLGEPFHLVWADPPFEAWTQGAEVLAAVVEAGLLAVGGVACLECPAEAEVAVPGLDVVRDLGGGASRVVLLRRAGGGGP